MMNPFVGSWDKFYQQMLDHDPIGKRLNCWQRKICADFLEKFVDFCLKDYRSFAKGKRPSDVAHANRVEIRRITAKNLQSSILYATVNPEQHLIELFIPAIQEFQQEWNARMSRSYRLDEIEEIFIIHELFHYFEHHRWGYAYQACPITLSHPIFRWMKSKPRVITELAAQRFTFRIFEGVV
jgi:hypothetical protein